MWNFRRFGCILDSDLLWCTKAIKCTKIERKWFSTQDGRLLLAFASLQAEFGKGLDIVRYPLRPCLTATCARTFLSKLAGPANASEAWYGFCKSVRTV
jgi:hypothetical protein